MLLFLTASVSLDAYIAQKRLQRLRARYGPFVAARFKYLDELVESLRHADTRRKLEETNDFWNGVRYGSDLRVWGKKDYWATPSEFLLKDRGDCEDYVIAKYFTLKDLGIDPKKLYFVYVRVRNRKIPHMVLAYYETPEAEPLILDSINYRIFPASKRKDIIPVYTFNGELLERYSNHSRNGLKEKNRKVKRKWEDLMQRMKRNEP
ncbi:transglutaminase-like cysteine peptidase [Hydrogenimonas urashimensis]|uniref:transglutaminase-like cysteine peptidase n=1 Tax=Hydrogenimonas urashimensis TaxID=2740515 RepID=UPI0019169B17|nr:transglutaminase-like cysteine peptidase [Hydrogenimonas urashimensis]